MQLHKISKCNVVLQRRSLFTGTFHSSMWLGMQDKIRELNQAGEYSKAFEYFQSLRRDIGYKPAPYITAEIADALDAVQTKKIPLCIHGWNTLIEYNTLLVSIQDSILIPDLMEQVGVKPDATTYANLFHGMVEARDLKLQNRIFTMMTESKLEPTAYVFNTLFVYYGAVKEKESVKILLEVMKFLQVVPDDHTAALMKTHFPKSKSVHKLFDELCQERGVVFPEDSVATLVDDHTVNLSYFDHMPKEEFDDEGNPIYPPELYADRPDILSMIPPYKQIPNYRERLKREKEREANPPPKDPLWDWDPKDFEDESEETDPQIIHERAEQAKKDHEEVMRTIEDGGDLDPEKLNRMFKEYKRNVGKLTPEQSAQFKKEAEERDKELTDRINEYEETRKQKLRENLPPHLQFPELSYEEMEKKHIELLKDPQGDMHLEQTNQFYFGQNTYPDHDVTSKKGFNVAEFVDTPENRQALIDKQKDLDAKIEMILDKFLEDSRKVNTGGFDLKASKEKLGVNDKVTYTAESLKNDLKNL